MKNKLPRATAELCGRLARRSAASLAMALCLPATGCVSRLAHPSVDLAAATAPVLDEAATAYRTANDLHDTWLDDDAVIEFDKKHTVYNPEIIQPLLSEHGIEVRLAVLAAFKCYVQSLVELTSGEESPQMQAAATSIGGSLTDVANQVAPTIEKTLGIAVATGASKLTTVAVTSGNTVTTTSSTSTLPPPPLFSPEERNGISTAADALGRYLVSRKIRKELPAKIEEMDPHLKLLCKRFEDDIAIIKSQEKMDYENILDTQTLFIRMSPTLQPQERREQIMRLPAIVRQHRATEEQLDDLSAALEKLYRAHHALADEARGSPPESLKDKLGDLAAAGSSLGKFYTALPAK